jgi:putative acetyltransferase
MVLTRRTTHLCPTATAKSGSNPVDLADTRFRLRPRIAAMECRGLRPVRAVEVTRDITASLAVLMDEFDIGIANPRTDDVRRLIEHHLKFGRSHSPPEDAHALDVDGLLDPEVTLFSLRCRGELLAIGALKRLDDQHAELKTMHTMEHARGRGIGGAMLDYLLAAARTRGFERVSLETGSVEAFARARSLYESAGFESCEPFSDYRRSPNSTYMSRPLSGKVS